MKLEDLKVIDIIQMPQFEKHIEALIKDLYLTRTKIMEITLHEILALVLFGSGMFSLGMNAGKYLYKKGLWK